MLPIEKGIPIPNAHGRPRKYPWRDLDIGDCFTVPVEPTTEATKRAYSTLSGCAGKHRSRKFVMRRVKEGIRVWRIA